MKTFKQFISEEGGAGVGAPTNATGTAVVGTGDDSSTVVIKPKKKKRKPTPIGRYRTRVAWKESFSVKDSKKLQKAAVLSTSDDPKDQDRARARRTEIDFKDLQRQIRARKKLKEGASILKVRGKRNTYMGASGDHKRDKDGYIVASHYNKKPAPTGDKNKKTSYRDKPKRDLVAMRARKKARREASEARARERAASERLGKKKVKEESLDKPVQSMITQIKSRAKKY